MTFSVVDDKISEVTNILSEQNTGRDVISTVGRVETKAVLTKTMARTNDKLLILRTGYGTAVCV